MVLIAAQNPTSKARLQERFGAWFLSDWKEAQLSAVLVSVIFSITIATFVLAQDVGVVK
jgi:hypothetical protein